MADLKPCPFCGGEARYIYLMPYNFVACKKCKKPTRILTDYYEQQDRKEEVIELWNRRVEDGK